MPPRKRPDGGRIYPFNFFYSRKEERDLNVDQRRDLGAVIELLPALQQLGWSYGEPILNTPPPDLRELVRTAARKGLEEQDLAIEPLPMDLAFLRPGDLILQTTRPPLDDQGEGNRKKVQRGYTQLEQILLEVWRPYFHKCARLHVRLQQAFATELAKGFRNRRIMQFRERTLAEYSSVGSGRQKEHPKNRTAAFLLRKNEIWPGGPDLIGAFGMDGTVTQGWAFRLAHDFPDLMKEPGFFLVEIEVKKMPERPLDLRWADDWSFEIALAHRF